MTDHLTLCSEERLRELLLAEKELSSLKAERDSLAQFAEARRVQINELMDAMKRLICEATPWSEDGTAIDCATNRACLGNAIRQAQIAMGEEVT